MAQKKKERETVFYDGNLQTSSRSFVQGAAGCVDFDYHLIEQNLRIWFDLIDRKMFDCPSTLTRSIEDQVDVF